MIDCNHCIPIQRCTAGVRFHWLCRKRHIWRSETSGRVCVCLCVCIQTLFAIILLLTIVCRFLMSVMSLCGLFVFFRNCNHFTSDFCQRLCGATPPRWVNRLARIASWMPQSVINSLPPQLFSSPSSITSLHTPAGVYMCVCGVTIDCTRIGLATPRTLYT